MRKTTSALVAVAVALALVAAAPSLAWARAGHHNSSGHRGGNAHHGFSGHHGGKAHHGVSSHHGGGSHHRVRSAHGSGHRHRSHGHRGFRTKVFVGSSVFFAPPFYHPLRPLPALLPLVHVLAAGGGPGAAGLHPTAPADVRFTGGGILVLLPERRGLLPERRDVPRAVDPGRSENTMMTRGRQALPLPSGCLPPLVPRCQPDPA